MTMFAVAIFGIAVLFCSSVGAAPSPLKNSQSERDGEGGSGGGGIFPGLDQWATMFPGLDQWATMFPGGTLPGGVTMPDLAAAVSAVSGAATPPPGFPTGFPTNINDVINAIPGVNP